ncbi:MAG: hypothetical protein ACI4QX_01125 [Lachnospiraceae bacterium]
MERAQRYYDWETYKHATRVANSVMDSPVIPEDIKSHCFALALLHNVVETTENYARKTKTNLCDSGNERLYNGLVLLTRKSWESYLDHVKRIKNEADKLPEVYWAKLADIHDHLQFDTDLSDNLRATYTEALSYLE